MSSIYLNTPWNLDVTGFVDSLHIDKHVNRIIFSNIAERHVSLIVSAPLNGFLKLSLFPGFSILCLCEPSLLRETVTRNTAFSKIMIHTYSDEVEFRIVPNSEHPVCTLFVEVSFSDCVPSLKNLAKTCVRANTTQKQHGNLANCFANLISHDFYLCQQVGEPFTNLKLTVKTPYGDLPTCVHRNCNCPIHCQKCTEKSHCCTAGGVPPCTGTTNSQITHNALSYTLYNC